ATPRAGNAVGSTRAGRTRRPAAGARGAAQRPSAAVAARAWPAPPSSRQRLQRGQHVGLRGGLVVAPAQDAREAYGNAGLVPAAAVHRLEAQLEHVYRFHRAYGAEAFQRMRADPAVELQ